MLTSLIIWFIIGGVAGWLASLIMGTDAQQGMVANVLIGILGAFIGGFLYNLLFNGTFGFSNGITGFNFASLVVATIGSVVLLALMKAFRNNKRTL
jgi:uncharacterized membrane protein YeaQ/YmgE (transglycosylase-associated protein family)